MCFIGITLAAVIQNSQPIESNAANVVEQISPEDKKSSDDDLDTAEFKHIFRRKFVPVAVPVAPVYVQPVPVPVQPVPVPVPVHQPVHHYHTPDCGCNNNGGGYQSYGYNYNYHYNY